MVDSYSYLRLDNSHYRHTIEMVDSYSCLRLDNRRVIQVEVYEVDKQKFFFLGNGMKVLFETLKVGQLAELIAHKGKFEVSDISKLWKVDVDKSKLNPGSTDDDIEELGGELMKFEHRFKRYFEADCKLTDNIHIVVTVSNISDYYPPKKRPRIIEALEGGEVMMTWNEQSDAIKSALNEPPIIIDNGVYSLGESEFKKFVTSGTFVDKSLFIMEFMIYGQRAILIIRPRRFGKSTNLSMLQTFLSVGYPPLNDIPDIKNSLLFKNLKVAQFEWFTKLHYKQWSVIHISFKDLGSESWKQMRNGIKERISDLYKKHRYVISILSEDDIKLFEKVFNGTTVEEYLSNSISRLARYLNEYFGKDSIILIDEYDWPMENARGFYDKADNFFRIMYSSVAKENNYVEKILFVGTLPLGQSSFSGLNNVVTYPMHERPSRSGRAIFSDTFGFTEEEIKSLLERKGQIEKLKELRFYYNGYRTSTKVHIYNPHSIISYLEKNEIKNYWINSGSTTTLVKYLKKCGSEIKGWFHKIINSYPSSKDQDLEETLVVELKPYLQYNDLDTKPEINALCTLLYYSGYLTIVSESLTGHAAEKVELAIPNRELAYQWILWIYEIMDMDYAKTNEIYESLFKKDCYVL